MDWFPLQLWRTKCPEIVRIASATSRSRQEVLGFLTDLWSWASSETTDGILPGMGVETLSSLLGGDAQLWQSVVDVGWLAIDANSLQIPNWDYWLSDSAKRRTTESRRKKMSRNCPQNVPQKSGQKPDKKRHTGQDRTVHKENPLPPFPSNLDTPEFRAAWSELLAYRKERKLSSYQNRTVAARLKEMSEWGHDAAIESIRQTIANSYQGVFKPKGNEQGQPAQPTGPPRAITRFEAAHGDPDLMTGTFRFNTRLCKDPECPECKPKRATT